MNGNGSWENFSTEALLKEMKKYGEEIKNLKASIYAIKAELKKRDEI